MYLDQSLFEIINGTAGRFQLLDFAGVFFARYLPYLLVLAFVFFLALERNWKVRFYALALAALSVILGRGIIGEAIRFFYYRPRPPGVLSIEPLIDLPGSASFPSGHALFFFALAGAVYLMNRRWGIWFFAGALLVGVARVFAGVHWPMDIVGGAILGIISAVAIKLLLRESEPKPKESVTS